MLNTYWFFCIYSSIHLYPNHWMGLGQVTVEAGSPDAALHFCFGSHAGSVGLSFWMNPHRCTSKAPAHTITPPTPCFTMGNMHVEAICSSFLYCTTHRVEPKISEVDSNQSTDSHWSIGFLGPNKSLLLVAFPWYWFQSSKKRRTVVSLNNLKYKTCQVISTHMRTVESFGELTIKENIPVLIWKNNCTISRFLFKRHECELKRSREVRLHSAAVDTPWGPVLCIWNSRGWQICVAATYRSDVLREKIKKTFYFWWVPNWVV